MNCLKSEFWSSRRKNFHNNLISLKIRLWLFSWSRGRKKHLYFTFDHRLVCIWIFSLVIIIVSYAAVIINIQVGYRLVQCCELCAKQQPGSCQTFAAIQAIAFCSWSVYISQLHAWRAPTVRAESETSRQQLSCHTPLDIWYNWSNALTTK